MLKQKLNDDRIFSLRQFFLSFVSLTQFVFMQIDEFLVVSHNLMLMVYVHSRITLVAARLENGNRGKQPNKRYKKERRRLCSLAHSRVYL